MIGCSGNGGKSGFHNLASVRSVAVRIVSVAMLVVLTESEHNNCTDWVRQGATVWSAGGVEDDSQQEVIMTGATVG